MFNNSLIKICLIILGFICLALGSVGIFLPILPTAPFILLSSICFMKSSDKLNNWFLNTKIYQNNIESLVNNKTMSKKAKIKLISSISIIIMFGFIMMKDIVFCRIILVIVWISHFIYFTIYIKTEGEEKNE